MFWFAEGRFAADNIAGQHGDKSNPGDGGTEAVLGGDSGWVLWVVQRVKREEGERNKQLTVLGGIREAKIEREKDGWKGGVFKLLEYKVWFHSLWISWFSC